MWIHLHFSQSKRLPSLLNSPTLHLSPDSIYLFRSCHSLSTLCSFRLYLTISLLSLSPDGLLGSAVDQNIIFAQFFSLSLPSPVLDLRKPASFSPSHTFCHLSLFSPLLTASFNLSSLLLFLWSLGHDEPLLFISIFQSTFILFSVKPNT